VVAVRSGSDAQLSRRSAETGARPPGAFVDDVDDPRRGFFQGEAGPFEGEAGRQLRRRKNGINAAVAAIREIPGAGRPPGSTIAGVGLSLQSGYPCWLVFNVGDSRVYLLRQEEFTQVTTDHSVRYAGPGIPSRNVITRALGAGLTDPLQPDQWLIPAQEGDQLLICSDGLYVDLTPQLMAAVLLSNIDPQQKADALVAAANVAGGRDNATAVVVIADTVLPVSGTTVEFGETTLRDDTAQEEELAL